MTKDNRSRNTALFLASQAISIFGSSITQFALIWHISIESDSGILIAVSTLFAYLPQIIVSLFAGVIADRYNRKHLIMLADLGIALSTFILLIIRLMGHQGFAGIIVIMAIRAAGSGIQSPAVNAVIPQIAPPDKLMRVNSINGTINSLVMLAAPVFVGFLLAKTGGNIHFAIMIDIVTAIIGVGVLAFIPIERHEVKANGNVGVLNELVSGIKYCKATLFLSRTILYNMFSAIFYSVSMVLNLLLIRRVFNADYDKIVQNEVAFFVGMFLGGLILSVVKGPKNKLHLFVGASLICGVAAVVTGITENFMVYLVAIFFIGLVIPCFNIAFATLMQQKVDESMLGRVFSMMQIGSMSAMIVGTFIFGAMADTISIQFATVVSSICTIIVSVIIFMDKKYMAEGYLSEKKRHEEVVGKKAVETGK